LPLFGRCASIGSGSEDLRKIAGDFDETLRRKMDRPMPIQDLIRQVANGINSSALMRELVGDNSRTWGGHMESAFFDPNRKTWLRGPPSIQIFLQSKQTDERIYTTKFVPRIILYDPGGLEGRILTMNFMEKGAFLFEKILQNVLEKKINTPAFDMFWPEWKVRSATFCLLPPPEIRRMPIYRTTVNDEISKIELSISAEKTKFAVSRDLLDKMSVLGEAEWGWTYRSS
jgi:hypothetical protein